MAKEIELDGAQGTEILTRKAFALLFVTLASLNTTCPGCGHLITRAVIGRVTWDETTCPKCGR